MHRKTHPTLVDDSKGIADAALQAYVATEFRHFEIWVEGLALCAKVCLYSRWLTQPSADVREGDVERLEDWLLKLRGYAERVQLLAGDSRIPHQRVMLVDPRRALDIVREGEAVVQSIRRAHSMNEGDARATRADAHVTRIKP